MKRIAIQGETGCFHEAAARAYFAGERIATVPCATFPELFGRMEADRELLGVAAIENTIAGSLLPNHELLRRSALCIAGEQLLRISHVLAALPGQRIGAIREVHSHPIALMQCGAFLDAHPAMKAVERDDTAGSAREIAERGLAGHAAVCSELAARRYGLEILARGIETDKHNFTRFLVLADPARIPAEAGARPADKASLVFSLQHARGTLSKVLAVLSFYDLNLTKIQSLPIVGREWEYRFYVDVTFDDPIRYRQAVEAVRPLMNELKILGVYARAARIGGPADDAAAGEAGVDARITE